ncbi:MAG: hypothetical protein JO261_04445 [Alphaproteobacteria bacterium]|nr:hypothetical protein [Alphaproteobacteria bacterium]MBV9692930.1 hypothetical protein [Alphaproteobacteria bacterium]
MTFVPLPCDGGWHYIDPSQIIGVQATGEKRCEVLLFGGLSLPVSEESYAVYKRLESHRTAQPQPAQGAPRGNVAKINGNGHASQRTW